MDMTQVLESVITIATAVITAFVIPLLKKKLSAADMDTLSTWVDIGVLAAEQLLGSGKGKAKKQFVINFLTSKGYTVNSDEIDNMIEASVHKLTNQLKIK
ncbi:MAG: phage holin, LLH family [Candidatus Metalachnospira sp.]|nr:phage holin, LLH family [Candidatus Metalachnospira sp.]